MIAANTQIDNILDLYLLPAFPPYFLFQGAMMSPLDYELHLPILARLHAQSATHLSLIILC